MCVLFCRLGKYPWSFFGLSFLHVTKTQNPLRHNWYLARWAEIEMISLKTWAPLFCPTAHQVWKPWLDSVWSSLRSRELSLRFHNTLLLVQKKILGADYLQKQYYFICGKTHRVQWQNWYIASQCRDWDNLFQGVTRMLCPTACQVW